MQLVFPALCFIINSNTGRTALSVMKEQSKSELRFRPRQIQASGNLE